MLTSDFYNVFSKSSRKILKEIISLGHNIGLHFDEVAYDKETIEAKGVDKLILEEVEALGEALGIKIDSVSMHRPSKKTLESDLKIAGIINSYGKEFFSEFKYVSDSRMRWRENVEEIIDSNEYNKLHILTHAFWYFEKESNIKDVICNFIDNARTERRDTLKDNITDLESIIGATSVS